jgi:Holliday junction resolvase RusA-like endonuclease
VDQVSTLANAGKILTAGAILNGIIAQYDFHTVILGDPQPEGSMRIGRNRNARRPYIEQDNERLDPWRAKIAKTISCQRGDDAPMYDEPVVLRLVFVMPRPAKPMFSHVPGTKPDLDKLVRAVSDALMMGKLIREDGRIVAYDRTVKVWPGADAEGLDMPGVRIYLRRLVRDDD